MQKPVLENSEEADISINNCLNLRFICDGVTNVVLG